MTLSDLQDQMIKVEARNAQKLQQRNALDRYNSTSSGKSSSDRGDIAVIQNYVERPMLLDGTKFDMRIYVLVLSLSPLRVFLCREGLVRFCAAEYEEPTSKNTNANNMGAHLTNYSLNKGDVSYVHSDDPLDGTQGNKVVTDSQYATSNFKTTSVYRFPICKHACRVVNMFMLHAICLHISIHRM